MQYHEERSIGEKTQEKRQTVRIAMFILGWRMPFKKMRNWI